MRKSQEAIVTLCSLLLSPKAMTDRANDDVFLVDANFH
jgi:hypothetical protein